MAETYLNGAHIKVAYHEDGEAKRWKGTPASNMFPGMNLRVDDKEITVVAAGPLGIVYIDFSDEKDGLPLESRLNGPNAETPSGKDWTDVREIFVW